MSQLVFSTGKEFWISMSVEEQEQAGKEWAKAPFLTRPLYRLPPAEGVA